MDGAIDHKAQSFNVIALSQRCSKSSNRARGLEGHHSSDGGLQHDMPALGDARRVNGGLVDFFEMVSAALVGPMHGRPEAGFRAGCRKK